MWKHFWSDQSGSTAIEYALISLLISLAIITGATQIGIWANATFNNVAEEVKSASN